MVYRSLDLLPLKLFLLILKTGNFSLLTDNPKEVLQTEEIWKKLQSDFEDLDPQNDVKKLLKTLIKVSTYQAQYNAISFAISALNFDRDLELENLLRSQGFKLSEKDFYKDLDQIQLGLISIQLLIDEHQKKLPPVKDKSSDKATNIDEVILGYCSVTSLNFDTNAITVTQFYALKKIFDQKLEVMRDQKEKQNKSPK